MTRRRDDPMVRVVLPLVLVLAVAASGLFFVRSQARRPQRGASTTLARHAAPSRQGAATAPVGNVNAVFEARVRALEERVEARPDDPAPVLELARLLHDGHRTEQAVVRYRQVVAMTPDDAAPYYDLASALAEARDWAGAADVLQDRLDRAPGDAVALYDLGVVRAQQGQAAEARRLLEGARVATSDGTLLARISQALGRLKVS